MGLLTGDALWPLGVRVSVAIFLLLVDLMRRRQHLAARYPPGPLPLPGLGNLLQMDFQNMPYSLYKRWDLSLRSTLTSCLQLRHQFGDMFSLRLAWKPVVVVNGLAAVHEALVKCSKDTADCPPMPTYQHLGLGPQSEGVVLAAYGPVWREQRPFSVSTMRNFGLGKKSLERWVTEEASCLCTAFTHQAGRPFSPMTLLKRAVCNVIASSSTPAASSMMTRAWDNVPFTMAVIHEVQCFGDIVPIGVPHMTSRDVEVQGFRIPRGTTLVTNLSSVLKDETVWEKPLRFHPGHCLDAQGQFVKREAFMPFSAGRRACLGEPLARMELFLFFTCLLQRFSFSVPPGQPWPSDAGVFDAIVTPSPYQLCAVLR